MCKHKYATLVFAWLEDGTPLTIWQCDMCGITLPQRLPIHPPDRQPAIDLVALEQAFARIWRELLRDNEFNETELNQ